MDNKKNKTDSPKITVVGLVPDNSVQPVNRFAGSGTRKVFINQELGDAPAKSDIVIDPAERARYKAWFDNRQKKK